MNSENIKLILLAFVIVLLITVFVILLIVRKKNKNLEGQFTNIIDSISSFKQSLEQNERMVKDEFQRNREESNNVARANREELANTLRSFEKSFSENTKSLGDRIRDRFMDFERYQTETNKAATENLQNIKSSVEKNLVDIREDNAKQLDKMRETVDEKLQKTLNERLSQSFDTVGKQLQAVQEGLGEMKNIASDVGGLKRVLSNVKLRGSFGEVQLSMLLEQIMAPDQYEANVKTNAHKQEFVEFAIKLPGNDDSGKHVWLPIDAKFPKDVYESLQIAYDDGDPTMVAKAQKEFDDAVKRMAEEITKYLDPPNTTDFAIMFLPFEGIYAEVVRKAALLEELQRKYRVIAAGPTTLAAILNSLQIGFKTLAIQKRSGEVWRVLSEVKQEFGKFGDLMSKAQKNIQTGLNQLDDVMGKRTKAIENKLKKVESLPIGDEQKLLSEFADDNLINDGE